MVAAVLYAVGGAVEFAHLLGYTRKKNLAGHTALVGGFFQLLFLVLLSLQKGVFPTADRVGVLHLFVLCAVSLYLATKYAFKGGGLGAFMLPLAFALTITGLLVKEGLPGAESGRTFLRILHGLSAVVGCGAFALSSTTAFAYLVQDRQLRQKRLSPILKRLASVGELDRLSYRAMSTGFLLFTVALAVGLALAMGNPEHPFFPDWMVVWSGVVWVLYALLIHSHFTASFGRRKVAILSILGFAITLGLFFSLLFVRDSLHKLAGG